MKLLLSNTIMHEQKKTIKAIDFFTHSILLLSILLLPISITASPISDADNKLMTDLIEMDLYDMMSMEITSVDKRSQPIGQVAAAITVLTQEDIHRSGATSVAELMRMVPGYIVTRIDANKWSVSSSEDSNRLADDMTVMIDNRPVYSSFFGGTFWEHIDLVFEDIERIEVIRGSAGKLWGTNMGRGLVNIITKSSKDSHGLFVSISGGTEERGQLSLRYGGQLTENINYRFFAKGSERDTSWADDAPDDWRNGLFGFRTDWQASKQDDVMLQTGYYNAKTGQRVTVPSLTDPDESDTLTEDAEFSSFYALTRWQHQISDESAFETSFFYDYTRRDEISVFDERDRIGLNFSNYFSLPWNQKILWGFYYLNERDRSEMRRIFAMQPDRENLETYLGYLQDEISFFDKKLRVSIGASVIKHTFITQPEFQPSFRMVWQPNQNHSLWLAVTRTFQMPNRLEKHGIHKVVPDEDNEFERNSSWLQLRGNSKQFAEETTGYQVGYRGQFDNFSVDFTGYIIHERDAPQQEFFSEGIAIFRNGGKENIYGVQMAANWQPFSWWRLKPTASYMFIEEFGANENSGTTEAPEFLEEAGWPAYQVGLRSLMNLSPQWEFDTTFRYVDKLQETSVKGYFNLDARLSWKPTPHWEFSIVGQNLLQGHHDEAHPTFFPTQKSEVERGAYARIIWRY